ncbi:putative glucose-6-phosphate 1-epimerase [Smittium mucronatum]|uniref:Glucose-6-phosphate 1-epimerase n=1 Tax=Smittium mucronatum TaxID=133383 RepID=A0A1R0H3P2_9FUNG|nr:putative glucose-6-phosphate 1-epimerase [Smittium mucronatum]
MPVKTTTDHYGIVDKVVLMGATGSACVVHTHGATITSWISLGKERIFLSKQAIFNDVKAIRGGIPVVFPQFGPGKLPQHGFARVTRWEFLGHKDSVDGVQARFLLTENEKTVASPWPYKFRLVLTVFLGETDLKLSLNVENTDTREFDFTSLLHAYFRTNDINGTRLQGLAGIKYVDKVLGTRDEVNPEEPLVITGSTDRVYVDAPDSLALSFENESESLQLTKTGFNDFVVWNPWIELAKGMSDFGDTEYQEMLCVEAGSVDSPVVLPAGQHWEGVYTMSVQKN